MGKWNIQTRRAPLMALLIFLALTVNGLLNGLLALVLGSQRGINY